jgi:hypothetical protein
MDSKQREAVILELLKMLKKDQQGGVIPYQPNMPGYMPKDIIPYQPNMPGCMPEGRGEIQIYPHAFPNFPAAPPEPKGVKKDSATPAELVFYAFVVFCICSIVGGMIR